MYWTELGEYTKIQRASMDGKQERDLIQHVVQPNGITIDFIDITVQRLYWCDTSNFPYSISYVNTTESGLQGLTTSLITDIGSQPFALTLSNTSVYWTDWSTTAVYTTHKIHGDNNTLAPDHTFTVYTASGTTPRGLEVVSRSKQPTGVSEATYS